MPAPTRFEVRQADSQTTTEIEAALNDLASDDAVAEIVAWVTVDADRRNEVNLIVGYRPTEDVTA